MEKEYLLLKRAAVSQPSGQCNDKDFDVWPPPIKAAPRL